MPCIARKISLANHFAGIIQPLCAPVTPSEGAEVNESVLRSHRKGCCEVSPARFELAHHLASVVEIIGAAKRASERAEIQHFAIFPKERIIVGTPVVGFGIEL